jgi:16S rRNA (guanine1207-N2)-methyltransferase
MAFRNVSGPVALASRALEEVGEGDVLVALPPEPGLPRLWEETLSGARYFYLDYSIYRRDRELLRRASGAAEEFLFFGDETGDAVSLAVLFAPKEKALTEFVLGRLAERVAPSGRVLVAGENRAGIRSVKPIIEGTVGPVTGHRSGRHSVIWEATRVEEVRPGRELRRTFEVAVAGTTFRAVSYPGVFSHGELDPGTRFLLETLDRPFFRRALDWGCGAGVIGTYLQLLRPDASVDLTDSHAMALRSARETLETNGLSAERVYASDGFSGVRGIFDLIVTNPPFHAGVKTELSVTERMIQESGRYLVPGGRLVLVANAFLRYPNVLRESFTEVRVLAENPSFRVYEAKNG